MTHPPRFFQKKKKDSDQLETIKEVLINLMRTLHQLSEQNTQTQKRIDQLSIWLTQYFTNQQLLTKTPSRPPPWIPKSKKEITTVVALVVFALTVLAIILASCGVFAGCEVPR